MSEKQGSPESAETLESDDDAKDGQKRERRIFALWLACHSQDAIADKVGWPQPTVNAWLKGLIRKPGSPEADETLESDDDAKDGQKRERVRVAYVLGDQLHGYRIESIEVLDLVTAGAV